MNRDTGYSTQSKLVENLDATLLSGENKDEISSQSTEEFKEFYLFLINSKPDWKDWTPISDIRSKLTPLQLKAGRKLLWEQEKDCDNQWEAMKAAIEGDENVVALAVIIAEHHRILNTMDDYRQTLLHYTSANCSPKLTRLIITRGADGAIPDVWGE